jgi:sugar phosphate isomerase/epimerase
MTGAPGSAGLWWGTVERAGLPELIDVAAAAGYDGISITPSMYFAARDAGHSDEDLRARLEHAGVAVRMVDPLIRGLPGCPSPSEVGPRFRATFDHGEEDCYVVTGALGVQALNLAHYLCAPTPVGQLVDAVGGISDRAAGQGLTILVEFMPEGSIPDLTTAAAIVRAVGAANCGVMLDTWHFYRTAGTLDELDSLPPGTIRAVQVSDARADVRGSGAEPPTRDRLVPGDGDIPLAEILAAVVANCPEVMVGVEVFNRAAAAYPPIEQAQRVRAGLDAVRRASAG